tara:strand:- start:59 stop:337 length:279 start_codon:yes stop_codon:yes gene_type:complete
VFESTDTRASQPDDPGTIPAALMLYPASGVMTYATYRYDQNVTSGDTFIETGDSFVDAAVVMYELGICAFCDFAQMRDHAAPTTHIGHDKAG